jgi:DNA invertase Pin-like site-specific DNA recombinase
MKYTIAKYLRISSDDADLDGMDKFESNSIANQRALLDDYIRKIPEFAGYEIIEALDDGKTGTNFSRPGVQRLIEMAQSGRVHCIIVKDLSGWGRNYLEVGNFLEQKFPAWGVRFISINDMYDSATLNGSTGGIDIAFRNLIYELYSQDLSVKVRSGKNTAAASGKICTTYPLYGYDKDPADHSKLVIDPVDSLVVKHISEWIIVPGAISSIITDEQFKRVQEKLALRSKPRTGKDTTNRSFFRRMVKCADCGRTMTFSPRKEGMGMFRCKLYSMTGEHNCNTGNIEESDIYNSVLALIQQQAALAGQMKQKAKFSANTVAGVRAEIQGIKGLVEKSKTTKITLWEKYHSGDMSKEKFQNESEKISAQAAAYNDKIAEFETEARQLELLADEENMLTERYVRQIGITELTQSLVDGFVKEIKVYAPDRIEVVFNYADEYAKLIELTDNTKSNRRSKK